MLVPLFCMAQSTAAIPSEFSTKDHFWRTPQFPSSHFTIPLSHEPTTTKTTNTTATSPQPYEHSPPTTDQAVVIWGPASAQNAAQTKQPIGSSHQAGDAGRRGSGENRTGDTVFDGCVLLFCLLAGRTLRAACRALLQLLTAMHPVISDRAHPVTLTLGPHHRRSNNTQSAHWSSSCSSSASALQRWRRSAAPRPPPPATSSTSWARMSCWIF